LKEILNPDSGAFIERYDEKFSVGDKVLQKKNNYDKGVSNGDIGFIVELDAEKRTMVVDFDGNLVAYEPADLDELVLAFAITVHKSQGSEFAVVVMPMDMSHFMMLKRNLLYTGITRAKKLMVLFGTKAAVRSAIQDSQIAERYSKLREWLLAAHLSRTGSAKAA